MRNTIFFLLVLIVLLLGNIIFYFLSEEYRFFVQKIKYPDEIVSSSQIRIDDSALSRGERAATLEVVGDTEEDNISLSALEFLESISSSGDESQIDTRTQELLPSDEVLEIVSHLESFNLQWIPPNELLFSITSEYPDPYLEWFSESLSLYSFPTKDLRDIYDIFDVLSFELPISLNQVNNFWTQSFFINMDEDWQDDFIRIVFEYENKVFWLKIKKLHYNEVRNALNVLR